jgi:hypothetical protein
VHGFEGLHCDLVVKNPEAPAAARPVDGTDRFQAEEVLSNIALTNGRRHWCLLAFGKHGCEGHLPRQLLTDRMRANTKVLWCGTGCDIVKSCDVNDTRDNNYKTKSGWPD